MSYPLTDLAHDSGSTNESFVERFALVPIISLHCLSSDKIHSLSGTHTAILFVTHNDSFNFLSLTGKTIVN